MKESYTPGHLAWTLKKELKSAAQHFSGSPLFDPLASREALRQIVTDLQHMYPHGHNQRETTLIEHTELDKWREALMHHPKGYGSEWGYVMPDGAIDRSQIQRSLDLRIHSTAVALAGKPSINDVQTLLQSERGINVHLLRKIADTSRKLNIHALMEHYQSMHPKSSIDDFVTYLTEESQKGAYSDSERKQLDFVATALSGAYQNIMNEYWIDNPDNAASHTYLTQNFSQLGSEIMHALDMGTSRDVIYRLIYQRVEQILEHAIGRDMNEADIDTIVAGFYEFIPDVQKQRGLRKRHPDTQTVRENKRMNMRWLEGLTEDRYGVAEAINGSKRNPFVRVVPQSHGVARSYHPKDEELANVDTSTHTIHSDMDLFYSIHTRRAEQCAFRIQEALSHKSELVIFVPTCPCDEIAGKSADGHEHQDTSHIVGFTGGPLVDGISWTGLNTIDGLSTVVPKLMKKNPNLRIRIIFATGDFEWDNGSTRGMTKEAFIKQLSKNHQSIAQYIHEKWGLKQKGGRVSTQMDETDGCSLASGDGRVHVDIQGLMGLAGGREAWLELESHVKENINRRFADPSNRDELLSLAECRRVIYEALRGNGSLDEETLLHCLREDVISYCAAHNLSRLLFDQHHRRTIILAGDSRPMEELAASIEGTVLLLVSGGYKGS